MLDIRLIKENPEEFKRNLARRNKDYSKEIDKLVDLDAKRRTLIADTEAKKAEQNAVSKKVPMMKKNGEDVTPIFEEMKKLSDIIKADNDKIDAIDAEIRQIILTIPNTPNDTIPDGLDDSQNVEFKKWGTPKDFGFAPKSHWDIGHDLKVLDPETATKVSGARFHFYRGLGARLERAVISYYLDTHTSRGYTEILPPFLVNRDSMTGTGQLPKFEEDAFKAYSGGDEYFLIPTAEVPVTNIHRGDILNESDLPVKYAAYSACFRGEVGSAGRDQKGLIRQHQFNKVELVKFANPNNSYKELETLTEDAEFVLQGLGLPYRVVKLCAGDIGFSSAMTNDIEVWMPSYNRYVEISSCSNFEDYQARRANIKFRPSEGGKPQFVHTLNGSGVAVGRTVAAILENYQNEDGSVTVPEALRKYMGCDIIK